MFALFLCLSFSLQGGYSSGKPGKLREFVHSGKLRENSGKLKDTQGIFVH